MKNISTVPMEGGGGGGGSNWPGVGCWDRGQPVTWEVIIKWTHLPSTQSQVGGGGGG